MSALNSLLLEGNLTADVDYLEMATGKKLAKFTIASNRWYRGNNQELVTDVIYLKVEVWGNLANSCRDYLKKGSSVKVIGALRQNIWKDEDGKTHEKIFMNAEYVDFRQPQKKSASHEVTYEEELLEEKNDSSRKKCKKT